MGFFNFIETFFFISLAITFILIMMLVYHFKDRLSTLENKYDAVYKIIENMSKEVNRLHMLSSHPPNYISQTFEQQIPFHVPQFTIPINKIIVSDDDEDDDDDDSDIDSEEDNENEDDGIVVSESPVDYKDLAVVEVDLQDPTVLNESNESNESNEVSIPTVESIAPELEPEDEKTSREIGEQNEDITSYKKMEVSALKTLVLAKGLATDVKKLKKTELVDLLISQL